MDASDTGEGYSFDDHAKHWSELKGFALNLQFNPRSAVSDADFVQLHAHIGQAPSLSGADGWAEYRQGLLDARALAAGQGIAGTLFLGLEFAEIGLDGRFAVLPAV